MDDSQNGSSCLHRYHLFKIIDASVPVTIISSVLSILGSLLIIATFLLWKDVRRSTARVILLFLAIADLGTGVGYFIAAVGFKYFFHNPPSLINPKYDHFCRAQSVITTAFPVASFFWTTCMGVYFLLALVFRRPHWGPKLLIIFNIIGWGLPFTVSIVMVSIHVLGPMRSTEYNFTNESNAPVSGAWCFVGDKNNLINDRKDYIIFEGICGKFWEILSYFLVAMCYIFILVSNRCHKLMKMTMKKDLETFTWRTEEQIGSSRGANRSSFKKVSEVLSNLDLKLMLIPIVFILLRIWGTSRYLASMKCTIESVDTENGTICFKDQRCYYFLYNFSFYLQAFCDPAQGFGNAILFILFSKVLRFRLMKLVYLMIVKLCCCCCKGAEEETDEDMLIRIPEKTKKKGFRVAYSPSTGRRRLSNSGVDEHPRHSPSSFDESKVEIQYGSFSSTNA